ncbi:MAG: PAS domain-containing protein [Mucilaginibacter sp.]
MTKDQYLIESVKSSALPAVLLRADRPIFSIVEINSAYLKLKGISREKLIGKGFFDTFYNDKYHDVPGWMESFEKVVTERKPDKIPARSYNIPVPGSPAKESNLWEINNTPITDDNGDVLFIIHSIADHSPRPLARENTERTVTASANQFYSLLQTIEGVVWEAEADTLKFTFVSEYAYDLLGFPASDWLQRQGFWQSRLHPGDKEEVLNLVDSKSKSVKSFSLEYRMIKADGSTAWIKQIVSVVREKGRKLLRGIMLDITTTKRLSNLENLERNVLELNSKSHVAIHDILSYYLKGVEAMFPAMLCSILQAKNGRLYNWASPSLPEPYIQAIDNLPIGENIGSCGTAAFLKKKVIVTDIESDARWAAYKDVALKYNLRACWSYPVINSDGVVMGTLGMYYNTPKTPNEEELRIIERVTSLLKIILENRQKAEIIADATFMMTQSQELAQFGNWHWDVQNNVVRWSDSLYSIYGLNKKDFKATFEGYQELLHPEDRQRVYETVENVLKTQTDVEFEERIIRPTGEIRYLKSWGKLKCDSNGMPIEMIGACLDITESKKTREELEASEQRLRSLADSQTNYVIRINLDGKYTYLNKKYIEDFDWILKDRELTDTDASLTVKPYHHQLVAAITKKCIKNPNKVYQVEIDKIRPDGGTRPTLWHFIGLPDSRGKTVEIQCIGLDITDLKNAETALKISNERYEYVNKATRDAIFDWDIKSGNVKWGDGFFRLFGFDSGHEHTIESWLSNVHSADRDKISKSFNDAIADSSRGNWKGNCRFKKANGSYAYIEGNGHIIRNDAGVPIRMIGAIRDITERLNYILAIEKQNKKLLEIAWTQSHVVRAPLSRIMGLTELIKDPADNGKEKQELLELLQTSANELDEIIRSISEKTEQIDLKAGTALK